MSRSPYPFLKWAGGKRQLEAEILERLPRRIEVYVEPFLGGGAVFFALARAGRFTDDAAIILGDVDADLIGIWTAVRDDPEGVIRLCAEWTREMHRATDDVDAEEIYRFRRGLKKDGRGYRPRTRTERAARLLWLNRHCVNGLWRKNGSGEFNVGWCRNRARNGIDADNLRRCSDALQGVTLRAQGFAETLAEAPHGAVAYLDPPYAPVKTTGGESFTRYGSGRFLEADQRAVAAAFAELPERGRFTCAVLSNSDTPLTRELYPAKPHRQVTTVTARRSINSDGAGRGPVPELLIRTEPTHYFAGWDNSLNHSAVVVIDADGDVVYQRQVVEQKTMTRAGVEWCPHGPKAHYARLCWMRDWYERTVAGFRPAGPFAVWCAIEGYVIQQTGHSAAAIEAGALLRVAAASAGWQISEYTSSQVKKAATGSGATRGANKVTKAMVAEGAAKRFGWRYSREQPAWDDLTDARVLAEMARAARVDGSS